MLPTTASLLLPLLAASATPSASMTASTAVPVPPNIVVILLDDVGVEKIGAYGEPGGQQAHTPTLDGLAQNGILFRNAYSNPLCGPTRAALMTGRHGFRTGFGTNVTNPGGYGLPDSELGLGEVVKTGLHPYATAAFGKWHLAVRGDDTHPVRAMGFDLFSGHMSNVAGENLPGANNYFWRHVRATTTSHEASFVQGPPWDISRWATSVQRSDLTSWIQGQPGPFLAFWSPPAPHAPFQVPPFELLSAGTVAGIPRGYSQPLPQPDGSFGETDPERLRQYYDAMLEATDTEIGRLLLALSQRPDDTWVFVVGDNGTPDDIVSPPYDPEHAKGTVFQQGVHVPLIVSGPGIVAPGREVQGAVHISDLWSTVADIAHAELAPMAMHPIDGRSLVPLFTDPSLTGSRRSVFCEGFGPAGLEPSGECDPDRARRCLTDGRYKYIYDMVEDAAGTPMLDESFYDLVQDPLETTDLLELDFWTPERWRTLRRMRIQMNRLVNG